MDWDKSFKFQSDRDNPAGFSAGTGGRKISKSHPALVSVQPPSGSISPSAFFTLFRPARCASARKIRHLSGTLSSLKHKEFLWASGATS